MAHTPRVILQALPSGEILDWAVPLGDADVTQVLTGPGALSGSLPEGYQVPVREWGSALWVESAGVCHGGGLVTGVGQADRGLRVGCSGVTGRARGRPRLAGR